MFFVTGLSDRGGSGDERAELLQRALDVARASCGPEEARQVLADLTVAAASAVPGAHYAGITVATARRRVAAPAVSHDYAAILDAIQERRRQSPCLDATRRSTVIYVSDLHDDYRWPRYRDDAIRQTPVRSVLAVPMYSQRNNPGALNFYSEQPGAFSDEAVRIGAIYAALCAMVWTTVTIDHQHRTALESREVIGQAKGLLMERLKLDADGAFSTLRTLSQDENTPLRQVADQLIRVHRRDIAPRGTPGSLSPNASGSRPNGDGLSGEGLSQPGHRKVVDRRQPRSAR